MSAVEEEPGGTARRASRPTAGTRAGKRGGGPRKTTAKAEAREAEIYRAAAQIFHRKGYAATSLQDIADEVGILKGSLYYYIDSKEDLLYGITKSIHDDSMALLKQVQAMDATPAQRLRSLIELHVARFGRNLTMIRVFYVEYGALQGARKAPIVRDRRRYQAFVEQLIAEGQQAGEFCPDLDPFVAANALLTMANSIYMWFKPGQATDIATVGTTYGEMAVRSLTCPPEHRHRARRTSSRKAVNTRGTPA
jgi:AcrR family transcriptional regulator